MFIGFVPGERGGNGEAGGPVAGCFGVVTLQSPERRVPHVNGTRGDIGEDWTAPFAGGSTGRQGVEWGEKGIRQSVTARSWWWTTGGDSVTGLIP